MTIAYETAQRGWPTNQSSMLCLEDRFEILKEIGDGSFGSVALGRTRSAGAQHVRKGTLVAIKTMKKSFDTFNQCLELREVIFLRTLPGHPHLVPAYDIFLDPLSKKLHIAMEYMDGNLYQLMKARDHKYLDGSSVKSILFQILSGLEHIHDNHFFHRDIKPENILVSTSAPDTGNAFRRYSALVTPPSTPPAYSIKIADFGLARETRSRVPYTTYVSTRWYRAPEVLLRAGEYSAPVDIWAVGAMAVEIATLKPLFPGGNEVDQVWRVCEIMGSPGAWINRQGQKVGAGEWKDGVRLAQKLGFSFPRMAPHSLETILPAPTWPPSLARFVTWCLMWDPKVRPTSRQALEHEYFADAVDPLIRPKSSSTGRIGRKISSAHDDGQVLATKTASWFRKSLGAPSPVPPAVPEHAHIPQEDSAPRPLPVHAHSTDASVTVKPVRPAASKRATWTNGAPSNVAPIPILPSIRPISPVSDTATAQAQLPARVEAQVEQSKKIGRQLSLTSQSNHYAELHRQEAERALTGGTGLKSPTSSRESFFAHLRKRARRLSGRHQTPMSPPDLDDLEPNAGCAPWATNTGNNSNRQSVYEAPQAVAPAAAMSPADPQFADLDRALQSVRYSLDMAASNNVPKVTRVASNPALKRHHSLPHGADNKVPTPGLLPTVARVRRSVKVPMGSQTLDEEDELLDEAISSARKAATQLSNQNTSLARPQPIQHGVSSPAVITSAPYMTPSASKESHGVSFGASNTTTSTQPVPIPRASVAKAQEQPQWPTPPYEENDWAASASASIFATQAAFR